jgi:CDP-glycerol glycerophosphotransferase
MDVSTAQGKVAAGASGTGEPLLAQLRQAVVTLTNELLAQKHAGLLRQIAPRKAKSDTVLFFGRPGFSDNAKYLYLHAAAQPRGEIGFTPVWCTANVKLAAELKNRGLEAFVLGQDVNQTLRLLLSAAAAVFCTNPREALGQPLYAHALEGSFRLQLWHGVGTKKIDLMLLEQQNLLNLDAMESLHAVTAVDAVLSPSARYDRVWREAFGADRMVRAGLPRNEVLLRPPTELEKIGAYALPPNNGLPRILFAPTFTYAGEKPAWSSPEILEQLHDGLPARKGYIFVKPHPFDRMQGMAPSEIDGIHMIPPEADLYPALRSFDLLVTDKSSLLTDFLLTDKPVVILEDGKSSAGADTSAENPFADVVPGLTATLADLSSVVQQALTCDTMQANRARLRGRIFATDPAASCSSLTRVLSAVVANRMESQKRTFTFLPDVIAPKMKPTGGIVGLEHPVFGPEVAR